MILKLSSKVGDGTDDSGTACILKYENKYIKGCYSMRTIIPLIKLNAWPLQKLSANTRPDKSI